MKYKIRRSTSEFSKLLIISNGNKTAHSAVLAGNKGYSFTKLGTKRAREPKEP